MIKTSTVLAFFILVCLNYIFLSTQIWVWVPDLFIVFILFLTALMPKLPNTYIFILYGFVIDLFFSIQSLPYTITFFLIGAQLNLSTIKWLQRSLLEQLIFIILASILLNILLSVTNDYYLNIETRIIINPLMNSLIWAGIYMTQRNKWLKNI